MLCRNLMLMVATLAMATSVSANGALAPTLFGHVSNLELSGQDQAAIAALLPMTVRDGVVVSNDDVCLGLPMRPTVTFVELNGAPPTEVIVEAGNSCTSGMTGQSLWLVGQSPRGQWSIMLEVAAIYSGIDSGVSEGWKDLRLAGRGHCDFSVWRHRNGAYDYIRSSFENGSPCTP